MKKAVLFGLLLMVQLAGATNTGKRKNPGYCIEISVRIFGLDDNRHNYSIDLVETHLTVDTITVQKGDVFNFLLKEDTHYKLRIKEEGKVVKSVSFYSGAPLKDFEKSRFDFFEGLTQGDNEIPQAIVSFKSRLRSYGARDYACRFNRLMQ